ncbi:MAG: twin-arginine translocation pathway signal protein [Hyphomicrobiaceae bacterium]|nr:MAG: twin-arginine translocation pathway signal protein [Hyphomicrobiaceae bacterium]
MDLGLSRRCVLGGGAAALAGLAASALRIPAAAAADVRWASLTPGFTVLMTEYIRHFKLDEKNGFKLAAPTVYTSVPTYYGDFVAGNYDVCIGSWDTFAVRHAGGVPIKLLCTVTTSDMVSLITGKNGPKAVGELKGKVIAAPQSTGTYRMTKAIVKEFMGLDLEADATVQNVTNPAASVTLLRSGGADAALSWEPNISAALAADANLQVIFTAGDVYKQRTGLSLPYFSVAVRNELISRDGQAVKRVNAVFKDCVDGIMGDVAGAVAIVGERTGFAPAVLKDAISSKRLRFVYGPMSDLAERKSIMTASDFFLRNGLLTRLPDDGFFALA